MRYDRNRHSLDRRATYAITQYIAGSEYSSRRDGDVVEGPWRRNGQLHRADLETHSPEMVEISWAADEQ